MKQTCRNIILLGGILVPHMLCAQHADTLPAVKVTAQEVVDASKATIPVQQLTKRDLSMLNSVSVADAVKYFSGVLIKDYGGLGGLKTISVRSLGANHTGVMYDGIMMGDAQGGQIDLGRFSLDNIDNIQLSISNPESILLPARSFASGSILSLMSSAQQIQKKSLAVRIKGGSFGFLNPSVSLRSGIGKKFNHALSTEYQRADGSYPYRNYVAGEADSKRLNADINNHRAEYDASYQVNDSNKLRLKLYYYNSERGLPGAVIFYNNFSSERLNNEVFFSQLSWQKSLSKKSSILLNGKFSTDQKYYLDPTYPNSAGLLENKFHQQETYFSGVYSYKITAALSASYAADYFTSNLKRTDDFAQGFANPGRDNFLSNIAIAYEANHFTAQANVLYTALKEKVQTGISGRNLKEWSPAASVSYQLSQQSPFRLRAFYKRIFRAPSFDDLYYTNVGNTNLRPEFVDQFNVGATFNKRSAASENSIVITADAYYNEVTDKILAVPRQNLFQWTMLNIGKVDIKGLDATVFYNWKNAAGFSISPRLSYTLQDARDMSDPSSALYKKQIPYTPKHSGAAGINLVYRSFAASYNALFSSYRYRLGDQVSENLVKEWATQDLSVAYSFKGKKNNRYRLTGELNNIFNKQYEIIKFYPMPGLNYRIGIIATFNQS